MSAIENGVVMSEVTEVKLLQFKNAPSPMLFTVAGIVTEAMTQSEKAQSPMLSTLLGIVIDERLVQPLNALLPMRVTPAGMSMEVKLLHSRKV